MSNRTYSLSHSTSEIETAISKLTAKGREAMTDIGNGQTSFFDDGIVEYSGIWGDCLVGELGHKSSGVVNRLRDLGLFTSHDEEADLGSGQWWMLTSLGADVANFLAGNVKAEETPNPGTASAYVPGVGVKKGAKWTYLYASDGSLIAELRNDQIELIAQYLVNGSL